jgi:hypothetical protein
LTSLAISPVLTINGNVYKDFGNPSQTTVINNVRSKERDHKGNLDPAPTTNYTLGSQNLRYNNGDITPYPGVPAEMCDFTYTINNGEDPEDIKVNTFLFDEGSGATKAKASTGIEMALGTVVYANTYCGSAAGDKDGDGVKDVDDSCPEIFNPKQEDTKEIALGFPASPSISCHWASASVPLVPAKLTRQCIITKKAIPLTEWLLVFMTYITMFMHSL